LICLCWTRELPSEEWLIDGQRLLGIARGQVALVVTLLDALLQLLSDLRFVLLLRTAQDLLLQLSVVHLHPLQFRILTHFPQRPQALSAQRPFQRRVLWVLSSAYSWQLVFLFAHQKGHLNGRLHLVHAGTDDLVLLLPAKLLVQVVDNLDEGVLLLFAEILL